MELSESNVWARLIVRGMQSIPADPKPGFTNHDDDFHSPQWIVHVNQSTKQAFVMSSTKDGACRHQCKFGFGFRTSGSSDAVYCSKSRRFNQKAAHSPHADSRIVQALTEDRCFLLFQRFQKLLIACWINIADEPVCHAGHGCECQHSENNVVNVARGFSRNTQSESPVYCGPVL